VTALSLVFTIDRTLNGIWRVRRSRPLTQRVLVYWAVITLGPLLLAGSLSLSSYLISASRGLVSAVPGGLLVLLDAVELLMLAAGLSALYRFVPNTPVRTSHAWAGALFATGGIEVARRLLAVYIGAVPTYSAVYGAFATVPILLVWIYLVWVVILLGAVLAAHLPGLMSGHGRVQGPGWRFELALEAVRTLATAAGAPRHGLTLGALAQALRVNELHLEPVLEVLMDLDWVGRLDEETPSGGARHVLLVEPSTTPLAPLMRKLLLPEAEGTTRFLQSQRLVGMVLSEAL
jgi:membrane protein